MGESGPCPSCGVVTQHTWYMITVGRFIDPVAQQFNNAVIDGKQGRLCVSKCASPQCEALALWIDQTVPKQTPGPPPDPMITPLYAQVPKTERRVSMVYPQAGVRIPPAEGLNEEEVQLYKEAAAVAPMSPRAGCALVRVLLEAYLKRHLAKAGHDLKGRPPLAKLIKSAEDHLDLSPTLKNGLEAIRKRGNTAVHDPYGLTDDTRSEDLDVALPSRG